MEHWKTLWTVQWWQWSLDDNENSDNAIADEETNEAQDNDKEDEYMEDDVRFVFNSRVIIKLHLTLKNLAK